MRRAVVLFVALTLAEGCSRAPPDATPEGAVRLWIDRMEASSSDPRAMREVPQLLGPASRANLEERARHATLAQGRRFESWEMLAVGRFGLRFRPKAMKASVVGDRATVEVTGEDPNTERASVRCVKEGAAWRVEPDLPDVPVQTHKERGS